MVLNSAMEITRAAGPSVFRGSMSPMIRAREMRLPRAESLAIRFGLGWAKSHSLFTGQTPVMKYNRG